MVFQNNLLAGASGVSGTTTFDTTLIEKSVWMDGSADGFTRAASDFDDEDGKEFTLGTWFQLTEFGVAGRCFVLMLEAMCIPHYGTPPITRFFYKPKLVRQF